MNPKERLGAQLFGLHFRNGEEDRWGGEGKAGRATELVSSELVWKMPICKLLACGCILCVTICQSNLSAGQISSAMRQVQRCYKNIIKSLRFQVGGGWGGGRATLHPT